MTRTTATTTINRLIILVIATAPGCSADTAQPSIDGGSADPGKPEYPLYIQPTRVCRAPLAGEPAGHSEGGQVCTVQAVAAATEEGRQFRDYADCSVVRTQRPYYPMPAAPTYRGESDPLLQDASYASELHWITSQLGSQGCSCCHSAAGPRGPVRFSIDAPGNWVGMMSDRDVAGMLAWYDVSMLDVWPQAGNNGFQRTYGMPSTDSARMVRFFEAEAGRRGLTRSQYADAAPTAGRLVEQRDFRPDRCAPNEGVARDGTITWNGTPARYLWVLAAGSANPTQVPDRDTPAGTLWRIDVLPQAPPMLSGAVTYAVTPGGVAQKLPADTAPAALQAGTDYYLYVDTDFFVPTTRCVFTY